MQICEKTIRQAFGKELGKKGVVSKNCEAEPAGFQKRVWSAVVINLEKGVVIFVFALEKKIKSANRLHATEGSWGICYKSNV